MLESKAPNYDTYGMYDDEMNLIELQFSRGIHFFLYEYSRAGQDYATYPQRI